MKNPFVFDRVDSPYKLAFFHKSLCQESHTKRELKPYILLKRYVHFFQINLNFLSVVEAGKSSVGAVEFAWRAISLT